MIRDSGALFVATVRAPISLPGLQDVGHEQTGTEHGWTIELPFAQGASRISDPDRGPFAPSKYRERCRAYRFFSVKSTAISDKFLNDGLGRHR